MTQIAGASCCVCGSNDARSLVDVSLDAGARATLCGSHELMLKRSQARPRSEVEVREILRDRRSRRDRRQSGDELGAALSQAFGVRTRDGERRRV
jgi:hypothetical protein